MCWSSSNLKGLVLLGGLSGYKMGSILYGSSPIHRDSKLCKNKLSHLVRSGCWGRQLCFPWIPLECGSWCLNKHFLLVVSEIVLLDYFLSHVPRVRCTKIPVPGQEPEEIRGGSAAHGEGAGRKWEGNEKLDSRADNAGGQSQRGDERAQSGWGESWGPLWAPGKSGRGVKPSLDPTDIPFSLQSNQAVVVMYFRFLYSPGNLSGPSLGKNLRQASPKKLLGSKVA